VFVDANVTVFVDDETGNGSGVLRRVIESALPWKTGGGDSDFVFGRAVLPNQNS
jgi:hypothetical protein